MKLIDKNLPAREWSSEVVDRWLSSDEEEQKVAAMSMEDYVRHSNYEMSFTNQIFSNTPFKQEELVPKLDTDQPIIMIEIEPDSAGAVQVDLDGDLAETFTPYGRRVEMTFQEIVTQRITKSQPELMAYRYNFRTVLTDLMALRMSYVKDSAFMRGSDACLAPSGTNLLYTGKPNNYSWGNGNYWSYERFMRSQNLMRHHENSIEPATCLYNHLMLAAMNTQLRVDFAGTTVAVDMFTKTNAEFNIPNFAGKMISTIKKNLVTTGKYYFYGPENQVGRFTQMIDPTMSVENRKLRISFQMYEIWGLLFINQAGVAGTTFDAANVVV